MDRIVSFSIASTDTKNKDEVLKLKKYCKETGTNFSYLILKAITKLNKELDL